MDTITGGCFCGVVRYRIELRGDVTSSACHCSGCRRASAAPAVAWITVLREWFSLTQGELATIRARTDEPDSCDGCGGERGFCARCGTPLTFIGDGRKEVVDVTTGSLDEPDRFPPKEDVFGERRVAWMPLLAP